MQEPIHFRALMCIGKQRLMSNASVIIVKSKTFQIIFGKSLANDKNSQLK